MKLRDKLFVSIGSLFLLTAAATYFIPRFLAKDDSDQLKNAFTKEIDNQRKEDFKVRKKIFHERVEDFLRKINETLYSIYEEGNLIGKLDAKSSQENFVLWTWIAELLFKDTELDFVQIIKDEKIKAGIEIDSTVYWATSSRLLTNNMSLVLVQKLRADSIEPITYKPLIGIRYPLNEEESLKKPVLHAPFSYFPQIDKPSIYYLYPIDDILSLPENSLNLKTLSDSILDTSLKNKESEELFRIIQKNAEEKQEYFIENKINSPEEMAKWFRSKNIESNGIQTSNYTIAELPSADIIFDKIKDPRALADLSRMFIYHFLFHINMPPYEKGAPLGACTLFDSLNNDGFYMGGGFLANKVFLNKSLFNAQEYYENNKHFSEVPIVDSAAIIASDELGVNFAGNVLKLNSSSQSNAFISLGKGLLSVILDSFSMQNEWIAVISSRGQILYGLDGKGGFLDENTLKFLPVHQLMESEYGKFIAKDESFYFYQLSSDIFLPRYIVIIVPEKQQPIYKFFNDITSKISSSYQKLTWQILKVILVVFGLAFLLLGFLSKKITAPISMLSKAASKVAAGRYSDIILPKKTDSKDEVNDLTISFEKMIKGLKDKEQIRGLLDKVVSKEIADAILVGNVPTNGQIVNATVLFADIRGFTKMTEHANPQFLLKFLNVYMDAMSHVIETFGGVIDKYVGDEIMAIYGAPISEKDAEKRAILSALDMLEKLNSLNKEFLQQGFPEIKIGIGINSGEMVAGNLGAENRLNYTVLGANVNLGSRLCQKAEPMQIRVTQRVLDSSGIKDSLEFVELDAEEYKGFTDPIKTFAIIGLKH